MGQWQHNLEQKRQNNCKAHHLRLGVRQPDHASRSGYHRQRLHACASTRPFVPQVPSLTARTMRIMIACIFEKFGNFNKI
jgi:hypothetical protein